MTDQPNVQNKLRALTQPEAAYVPLSVTSGQGCANCRWFCPNANEYGDDCHLVESYPDPILPTGWCNRWEKLPPIDNTIPPMRVVIVDPDEVGIEVDVDSAKHPDQESTEQVFAMHPDLWEKLTTQWPLRKIARGMLPGGKKKDDSFITFKGADGKHYWVARYTNNFKDRDGEWFEDTAHEEFVKLVNDGVYPMPELWTWHTKGTRHGVADQVWKAGAFVFALGHFDDTPSAKQAIHFYQKNKGKIRLSHGFYFPRSAKVNGVFRSYRTFEITTLPEGFESNPYTEFEEMQMLSDAQRNWIKQIGGDTMLKDVEARSTNAEKQTDELKGSGVSFKGVGLPVDDEAGTKLRTDVDKLALAMADFDTSLKTLTGKIADREQAAKAIEQAAQLVVSLPEQITAIQKGQTAILERFSQYDVKLAEQDALKPPGSKSGDTLLDKRESTFLAMVEQKAKDEDVVTGGKTFLDQVAGTTHVTGG